MNQQQRKYVRNRLEAAYNIKRMKLNDTLNEVKPAFSSIEERRKYINAAIKGNPKIKSISVDTYRVVVVTDKDEEYTKRLEAAKKIKDKKSEQLSKIYREAMDDVMLGDDAATLTAALNKIENFKID